MRSRLQADQLAGQQAGRLTDARGPFTTTPAKITQNAETHGQVVVFFVIDLSFVVQSQQSGPISFADPP
jgi:hypothetical protein